MKTKLLSLVGVCALLAASCVADSALQTKIQVFEWTNRPQLSAEQQELLHVYTRLDNPNITPEKRETLKTDAKRISSRLGAATVRHARPEELVVTGEKTGVATIFNPSADNVAFTVSVRGDEQRLGTRMASMGGLTFLPPKASLHVPNLYWMTPSVTHKN